VLGTIMETKLFSGRFSGGMNNVKKTIGALLTEVLAIILFIIVSVVE
jgi:hypothetical protein